MPEGNPLSRTVVASVRFAGALSVWQLGILVFASEMIWDSSLLPVNRTTMIIFVYM